MPTTAPRTDAGAGTAVARLALSRIARAALVWGAVFAIVVASSVLAYRSTYGTPAERAGLLRTVTANAGVRALFGPAREIDTVTGFLAWRTLGLLPLVAGVWGLLAATRLLRGEEDSGRWETLLSGPVSRARATLASLAAVAAASALLFAVTAAGVLVGVVLGDVPLGGGLFLALALCGAAPALAAVGALTSQLAPTRREAAALGGAVFAVAFLLRVAADASPSAHGCGGSRPWDGSWSCARSPARAPPSSCSWPDGPPGSWPPPSRSLAAATRAPGSSPTPTTGARTNGCWAHRRRWRCARRSGASWPGRPAPASRPSCSDSSPRRRPTPCGRRATCASGCGARSRAASTSAAPRATSPSSSSSSCSC